MDPRLVAIDGQWKGTLFPLSGQEVRIGREADNEILLADPAVSRSHCLLEPLGPGYEIRDLDSRNGTFVNGVPVRKHALEHGDRVEIGRSSFLYLDQDSEKLAAPNSDESSSPEQVTLITRMVVPVHHGDEIRRGEFSGTELHTLLRISTAIHSVQALYAARESSAKETLERQILQMIFESVPAERGAIVLLSEFLEAPAAIVGWSRIAGRNSVPVDRGIVDQVISEGVALLSNDISASEIRCLMAVPLSVSDKVLGVIYLDSTRPGAHFDQDHLQLVTAIAGIASMALENARYVEWLQGENSRLREEINVEHNMVGESPAIQQVCQFIARVAATESTVLITGESGTGKELVARAIHKNSPRANKPFVAVNCAALTDTLLESEFFGHEKGSFTGAIAQKRGKLEVAEGGTIFLDEIGEMAPGLQAKLLRVLQEHSFERVGGTRLIDVDVRVIAATNRDLLAGIKSGIFRLDLYYRLNVVSINMPPLRERRQDIPLLARYFASMMSKNLKRPVMGLTPEALACLVQYDWPGNIRELENAIERAVVLGSSDVIRLKDLPETILDVKPSSDAAPSKYHSAVQDTKRQAILRAIEQANGNITEAARIMGLHPNYLHRLIRNLNLRPQLKKFA
jgi:Nif-specific regulatory protein